MAWTDELGGFWTVSRYEDVRRAALDTGTFVSDQPFTGVHLEVPFTPLCRGGAEHR